LRFDRTGRTRPLPPTSGGLARLVDPRAKAVAAGAATTGGTTSPTRTPAATLTADRIADLFAGLTATDRGRIVDAMVVVVTESARTVYGHTRRRSERWCAGLGDRHILVGPLVCPPQSRA
jgi:hypothetical protein